jgi:hypothetical protein
MKVASSSVHFLIVARKAILLPIDPAGVDTGTSTSSRCSPADPQAIDGSNTRSVDPTGFPSIAIACEGAASSRAIVTFTRVAAGLPGQSTRSANRVEITNDLERLSLACPGADVPLKYDTRPKSSAALPAPWLRTSAPADAVKIVTVGATDAAGRECPGF